MADQLSIILSTKIGNTAGDISNLNNQIQQIQKKLNGLNLSIKIDDNVTKLLNDFTQAFSKIENQAKNLGKVIEESILPDGTKVKRTYFDGIKGEFSELVTQAKQVAGENKDLGKTVDELTSGYDKLARSTEKYNAEQKSLNQQLKYTDQNGVNTRTVNVNGNGNVSSYTDTTDYTKQAKLEQQAIKDEEKLIEQMESFRLQSISRRQKAERDADTAQLQAIQKNMDLARQQSEQEAQLTAQLDQQLSIYKQQAEINAQSLTRRMGSSVDSTQLNSYLNEVRALSSSSGSIQEVRNRMQQLGVDFRNIGEQAAQTRSQVSGFSSVIGNFGKQMLMMPIWMASWTAMMAPIEALHSIVTTIIDVDTAMTQLKRVMNSNTDFTGMLQKSIAMSTELGSKLTDVLNIETEFARQGFNENDVLALTKVTSLLVNIGDLNPTQAMTTVTSAMKNFNVSAQDSITIADKLNNISNNFSANTATLSDGLTKAATTAKTYGVSLNDLLGMETAISETTKESGDIIGNSLKTIFSRLESNSSVNVLKQIGIETQNSAGEMRSATSVMGDLASKWDKLSSSQQQQIAVTIAGRFQLTRFLALMQDWGTVVNASNTALNSQNSAINENARFQQSLQARLNDLNTAWKKLSLAIGDEVITSSLVGVVQGLQSLVTVMTPVARSIGIIPTTLGLASIAFTTFKIKSVETVGELGLLGKAFQLFGVEATAEMTAFKVALASTGVGLAVLLGSMGIEALLNAMGKAQQKRTQEQQQINNLTDSYTSNAKAISNYVSEYKTLSDQVTASNGKVDKNNESYKQYLDVQNKLGKLMPSLISYTDADGQAHLKSASNINTEIKSVQDLQQAKTDLNAIQIKDDITSYAKSLQKAMADLKKAKDQYSSDTNPGFSSNNNPTTYFDTIAKPQQADVKQQAQDYLALANAQYQLQVLQAKSVSYTQQQTSAYLDASKASKSLTGSDKNLVNAYIVQHQNQIETKGSTDDLTKSINDLSVKATDYGKVIASIQGILGKNANLNFLGNYSESQDKTLSDLLKSYKDGSLTIDEFTARLTANGYTAKDQANILNILAGSTKNSSDATNISTDAIKAQTDAQNVLQGVLNGTSKIEDVLSQEIVGYTAKEIDQQTQLIQLYSALSQVTNKNAEQMALYNQVKAQLISLFPEEYNGQKLSLTGMMDEVNARKVMSQAAVDSASNRMSAEEQVTYNLAQNLQKQEQIIKAMIKNYEALMMSAVTVDPKNGAVAMSGVAMHWYNQMKEEEKQLSTVSASYISTTAKLAKQMNYKVDFTTPDFPSAGSSGAGSSKKGSKGSGSGSSSSAANDAKQKAQDLANSIVQIYKDMYQKEEDMALAANQKQLDALDKQHQKVMDNLTAEEKAYEDSVNKKLALIDKQSAAQSYNEGLKQKQQAIQDLQNQINVMSLDNSPEGQAKLADLKKQLAQDQQDLTDTQSQHTTDLRKQNLQDGLDSYKADIQRKQDAEDAKYNAAKDELNKERDAIQKHYDNLINDQRKFTKIQNEIMSGHYDQAKKDLAGFTKYLKDHMSDIGQSITENLLDNISAASKSMSSLSGKGSGSSSGKSSGSSSKGSSSSSSKNRYYTVKSGDTLGEIADKYYGHSTKSYIDKIAKANHISDSSKIKVGERLLIPFKDGGYTGNYEGIAYLHQKEQVFKAEDTTNLLNASKAVRGLAPLLQNFVQKVGLPDINNVGKSIVNHISMPINIDNLQGGKEGANELFKIIGNKFKIMGVNN